jgi:hypothetical protein
MHLIPPALYAKLMSVSNVGGDKSNDAKCLNINQLNSIQNEDGGKVFISQKPEVQTSHTHLPSVSNVVPMSTMSNTVRSEHGNPNDSNGTVTHNDRGNQNASFILNTSEKVGRDFDASISNASGNNDNGEGGKKREREDEPSFVFPNKKLKQSKDINQSLHSTFSSILSPESELQPQHTNEPAYVYPSASGDKFKSQLPGDLGFTEVPASNNSANNLSLKLDVTGPNDLATPINNSRQQVTLNMDDSLHGKMSHADYTDPAMKSLPHSEPSSTKEEDFVSQLEPSFTKEEDEIIFKPRRASSPINSKGAFLLSKPVKRLGKQNKQSQSKKQTLKSKKRVISRSKEEITVPQEKEVAAPPVSPPKDKMSPVKKLKMAREAIKDKYKLSVKGKVVPTTVLSKRPKPRARAKSEVVTPQMHEISASESEVGTDVEEDDFDNENNVTVKYVSDKDVPAITDMPMKKGMKRHANNARTLVKLVKHSKRSSLKRKGSKYSKYVDPAPPTAKQSKPKKKSGAGNVMYFKF